MEPASTIAEPKAEKFRTRMEPTSSGEWRAVMYRHTVDASVPTVEYFTRPQVRLLRLSKAECGYRPQALANVSDEVSNAGPCYWDDHDNLVLGIKAPICGHPVDWFAVAGCFHCFNYLRPSNSRVPLRGAKQAAIQWRDACTAFSNLAASASAAVAGDPEAVSRPAAVAATAEGERRSPKGGFHQ